VRFTILARPGSDPGELRAAASAVVIVDSAESVAAAARASEDACVVLLGRGVRVRAGALRAVRNAASNAVSAGASQVVVNDGRDEAFGVLGGVEHDVRMRRFGWMLAPVVAGPLPFELASVAVAVGDTSADAALRGAIDVVAPGMVVCARELLIDSLPDDDVAAAVELCARARAAGRTVRCDPAFACDAPVPDADDRGRIAALRALAERRPELVGAHRLPLGLRRATVDREIRLPGGRRERMRTPLPRLTVLVHGAGAELAVRRARDLAPGVTVRAVGNAAEALRAEMRVRGDRYVLVADAASVPDAAGLSSLIERIESAPFVAIAAPDAESLDGRCVLLALARFPQHVEATGATIAEAMASLVASACAMRRAVRAPGFVLAPVSQAPRDAAPGSATIVFAASSSPEIMRLTLTAVVESTRAGDELVAVCAASAETARRIVASFPQIRLETDAVDPLLADALNRAAGAAGSELVVLIADDVLLPGGALDRVRAAFTRIPALGAAFAAVPGAPGGEGVRDVNYSDIAQLRTLAQQRMHERARETEPLDVAVTPVLAVTREALHAVGGIDPAFGPTRRGIADLVQRLRAAGYTVVRCDDALVHRFDPAVSRNPAAAADAHQPVPAADQAAIARGFDPARRVPFVRAPGASDSATRSGDAQATGVRVDGAAHRAAEMQVAIAVPVATSVELERAVRFLGAAARAFDASTPVRVHLLLDGDIAPPEVAARVRPVLATSGRSMDETVAVRIERVRNLAAWRANAESHDRVVVAAGHERDAFAGARVVDANGLRDLLVPVAR
jgi:GT2 family glycosyltransferase